MSRPVSQASVPLPVIDDVRSPRERGRERPAALAMALATVVYALFFGWLSLREYQAFTMHALDMGNMAQAAWNTIHGHPFRFTNMRLAYGNFEAFGTTTRLSFHVEALFPLISLVYLLYPHPESLLILQTVAIAAGAPAVYLLARDALRNAWAALSFSLAYLLFPTLEALNLYEFHPVALATPLLLWAFLFAWRRQYIPFILCCLAAMGAKEEIGLVVAMFGLYVALVQGQRRVGIGVAALGTAWSLFAVLVIEKHYRQPGSLSYAHSRYGYVGHGLGSALHTLLHNPGVVGNVVFTLPKLDYLERLFAAVGFLPLAAPLAILLGAPTFALNLLSSDPHMSSGLGDNSAELVSVMLIAAVLGARRLVRWSGDAFGPLALAILSVWLLAMSLWNAHLNGFTPIGPRFAIPVIGNHQRVEAGFMALAPSGVPLSTQDELNPHVSNRRYTYLFEDTGREPPPPEIPANAILLDVSGPTFPLPSPELAGDAMRYINRPGWGVAAADDGLILIEKGAPSKHIPVAFYRYAQADRVRPEHRLHASELGLRMVGYRVQRSDLANFQVPRLMYTIYLRPTRPLRRRLQPVLYERMGPHLVSCAFNPWGLAWLPTTRWRPGHTYAVHMDYLEVPGSWQREGRATIWLEIRPGEPIDKYTPCSTLWATRGAVVPAGSQDIRF